MAPAHDWWDWYAPYLLARQGGAAPDAAARTADRHLAEAKGVVRPQ